MQSGEHHVFFEFDAGTSLLEAMEELEPWLDENQIRTVEFRHTVTPSGSIELQLTFGTRHEASLFERAFCETQPHNKRSGPWAPKQLAGRVMN